MADYSLHQFPATNILKELKAATLIDIQIYVAQIDCIPQRVAPGLSEPVKKAVIKMDNYNPYPGQRTLNNMSKIINIKPITRIEGHASIHIRLDDLGNVDETKVAFKSLRGFEKFVQGKPAEELPRIVSRICGI